MKRAEKKGHLVDVAIEMFNRYGYHAVGVDSIIAEAGVAKTTLYRHFETKELLIAAAFQPTPVPTLSANCSLVLTFWNPGLVLPLFTDALL